MQRWMPAVVSLVVGIGVLAIKVMAASSTGSSALMSDALEATVNVVAAAFAVWSTRWASQPADRDHPYGHGKMEFISALLEGGMVALAAVLMVAQGVRALMGTPHLRELDTGLVLSVVASAANAVLGVWLVRVGKRLGSLALEADGRHVLSDVWTSAGALVGLVLVKLTGMVELDAAVAVLMGVLLLREGAHVVRRAVGALMDEEDPDLVARLDAAFASSAVAGMFGAHRIRTVRAGNHVHVDAHIHVPRDWTVARAHAEARLLEKVVKEKCGLEGELALHLDPYPNDPA